MTTLIDTHGREEYRQKFLRDGFVVIENGKHLEQLMHQHDAIIHTKMVAYKRRHVERRFLFLNSLARSRCWDPVARGRQSDEFSHV